MDIPAFFSGIFVLDQYTAAVENSSYYIYRAYFHLMHIYLQSGPYAQLCFPGVLVVFAFVSRNRL